MRRRRLRFRLFAVCLKFQLGHDAVGERNYPTRKNARVFELEGPATTGWDEGNSAAEENGDYGNLDPIDEACVEKAAKNCGASEKPDGFPGSLLQIHDRLRHICRNYHDIRVERWIKGCGSYVTFHAEFTRPAAFPAACPHSSCDP
jgi:hypothetical protein